MGGRPQTGIAAIDATSGAIGALQCPFDDRYVDEVFALATTTGVVYLGGICNFTTSPRSNLAGLFNGTTGVEPERTPSIGELRLTPNPFRSTTDIAFTLPRTGHPQAVVVDLLGRTVCNFRFGERPAGIVHERWNGRDDQGRSVPPGLYFIRLRDGALNWQGKVLRLE